MSVIEDITMVSSTSLNVECPTGFTKLIPNTNWGAGGDYPFVCIKKGSGLLGKNVTDILVTGGTRYDVPCPVTYEKILTDTNEGASGDYVFICKKRELNKPPLTDIVIKAFPDWESFHTSGAAPAGYERVNYNLNNNAGGYYIYLYKKRSTWSEYCNLLINNGIGFDNCVTNMMSRMGEYDNYMKKYCALSQFANTPECSCINSDILNYQFNPLCTDRKCIDNGYATASMLSSRGNGCQIVDCSTYLDVTAKGNVIFDDTEITQRCGTMNRPPPLPSIPSTPSLPSNNTQDKNSNLVMAGVGVASAAVLLLLFI